MFAGSALRNRKIFLDQEVRKQFGALLASGDYGLTRSKYGFRIPDPKKHGDGTLRDPRDSRYSELIEYINQVAMQEEEYLRGKKKEGIGQTEELSVYLLEQGLHFTRGFLSNLTFIERVSAKMRKPVARAKPALEVYEELKEERDLETEVLYDPHFNPSSRNGNNDLIPTLLCKVW